MVHVKRHSSFVNLSVLCRLCTLFGNCNSRRRSSKARLFESFCVSQVCYLFAIRFLIALAALIRNQFLSLSSTTIYDLKPFLV